MQDVAKICAGVRHTAPAAPDVLKRADEEGTCEEMLSFWCYKADTDHSYTMDARLRAMLDVSPSNVSKEIIAFIKQQLAGDEEES